MGIRLSITILLLLVPGCLAFGGVAKDTQQFISPGESGRFQMLFWGDEQIDVLATDFPQSWTVLVQPDHLNLSGPGDELISTGAGYQQAKIVDVFVRPDGPGSITISARASRGQGGITFSDERHFKLDVTGEKSIEEVPIVRNETHENPSNEEKGNSNIFIYVVAIIAIIAGSILLYKRS